MTRSMNNRWIRVNGQDELRENIRTALKQAGYTQAGAAREAGVRPSRMSSALARDAWFSRDDVSAIAALLEMPTDELVGDSIFKDQPDRFAEFDFKPHRDAEWCAKREAEDAARAAERAEATQVGEGRTRAICCECGTLRTCTSRRYRWEPSLQYAGRKRGRFTDQLRCLECQETTLHAILRTDDDRDEAEQLDRRPSRLDVAIRERDAIIEQLREFNVLVTYRRGWTKQKTRQFYSSGYEFNTNTMQWEISLDENMPPRLQVIRLRESWERISTGDHGVDWDPRDGVWTSPGRDDWNEVVEDLVADIDRLISVERRKLAVETADEAAAIAEQHEGASER